VSHGRRQRVLGEAAGGRGEGCRCLVRTRPDHVSVCYRCGEDLRAAGMLMSLPCWALATEVLGAGVRHSGLTGGEDPLDHQTAS
jgi:hypothetical protein